LVYGIKKIKYYGLTFSACAALLMAFVQPAHAEGFSDEQKKELKVLFEQFIDENPEAIMKSVEKFRAMQEERTTKDATANLGKHQAYFAGKDLPIAGNPDGDITMVEFYDYNCGYCRRFFEDLVVLLKDDKNLRVVFLDMPILSPTSELMARYSLAAHKQGKYFDIHQAFMAYKGPQTEEAYNDVASKAGLDMTKLKTDLADPTLLDSVKKNMEIAQDLGVQGTPGMIVGEQIFRGYIGLEGMKKAVQEERAKKKAQ
jgi:protein-disulfide isomerase